MNVLTLAPILVALLPLAALAGPPQAAVPQVSPLQPATLQQVTAIEIDCAQRSLPSQQAVSRLLGIDNFGQAYDARTRLMIDAQRDCKRLGVERLKLVLRDVDLATRPIRALADATPRH